MASKLADRQWTVRELLEVTANYEAVLGPAKAGLFLARVGRIRQRRAAAAFAAAGFFLRGWVELGCEEFSISRERCPEMPISFYPLSEPWYAPAVTEGLRRARDSSSTFTVIGQWLDELAAKEGLCKDDLMFVHTSIIRQLHDANPDDWKPNWESQTY